ncbi:hypothetical protein ACFU76_08030 [Streptomyces sp. NPDC057539]|uniref:hypothetical protein n=1 Tax=Streptomyces sp. NPDC057539 TaxID=3346159 RepID=UPI0036C082BB
MSDPTDEVMYDAVEGALWQDLADALNRLAEYGLDPIAGLADELHVKPILRLDAGDAIHGGGVRKPGEGYFLRDQAPFTPGPDGSDLPSGWIVERRAQDGAS